MKPAINTGTELAQSTYLQTVDLSFHFHIRKAEHLRTILQHLQSFIADSSS